MSHRLVTKFSSQLSKKSHGVFNQKKLANERVGGQSRNSKQGCDKVTRGLTESTVRYKV